MIRERLSEAIQSEPDLSVCGEAEDGASALSEVERTRPDLVVVDLSLKRSHGLELTKDLRSRYPRLGILVLTMHDESVYAERLMRAGASGYITKQEATKNVLQAIRTVLQGGVYLSQATALRLATEATGARGSALGSPADRLTDRELCVFQLIGEGCGTRQIAGQMRLGMATIETYRSRIKEKLHLKDADGLRQSAVRWVRLGAPR
jgi:DNA-binding NarL/FixJ family response regulator